MSIPRFAIQRPVMMAMISSIIILIGGISLSRLPVDLLPDISTADGQRPRELTTGVGPLEMEELVVRPLEQQLSAVSGLDQMNSSANEGSANIQLNFTCTDPQAIERHPDAHRPCPQPPARGRRSAGRPRSSTRTQHTIMGLALESTDGALDRVALRELAENVLSPRLERVSGVAAVTVGGGLRRQIPRRALAREKITALDLSVDRIVGGPQVREPRTSRSARFLPRRPRRFLLRSQGQFANLEQIRNLVVDIKRAASRST